jgi:hypothetical protein
MTTNTDIAQKNSGSFSDKSLIAAGFAQAVFIYLQTMTFPELGYLGAIVAAQCALMPWAIPLARTAPTKALAMVIASALLSPAFSFVCQQQSTIIKFITGG